MHERQCLIGKWILRDSAGVLLMLDLSQANPGSFYRCQWRQIQLFSYTDTEQSLSILLEECNK